MCQTVEETVQQQHAENSEPQKTSKQESSSIQKPSNLQDNSKQDTSEQVCPLDCPCRNTVKSFSHLQILFNVMGILFAVFATYLMITTDSNLYLIFWICFSVLRRMMGKTRKIKRE